MAKPEYLSLSKRIIDRLSVDDKDTVFWDRDLPGFGIRVYPSGAKVYVVQTRVFGRSKRFTVGRHGRLSADQARRKATRIIARIKAGEPDPLEEPAAAPTVADLAERYQREYVAMHCKPLTLSHYGLMLRKHIVPALGKLLVSEVERKHITGSEKGARCPAPVAGQPVGDCRSPAREPLQQPERPLACGSNAGRARRRADPRPPTQLRFKGARVGGKPADDRETPRPPEGADHGPLRPPCARVGEDVGREGRREHCGRYGIALLRASDPVESPFWTH